MLSRNERELEAVRLEMERHGTEAKSVIDGAEKEDRDRTDKENSDIAEHQKAIGTLRNRKEELESAIEVEKDVHDLSKGLGGKKEGGLHLPEGFEGLQVGRSKSMGEQFVESEGYKRIIAQITKGESSQTFSTGAIKMDTKAGTLLEGGQGTGFIPVPQVLPGVTETLFQRLTVADLFMSGTTNTNSLRYIVEGTATSGAAGVAEGGAKPASDLALSTVDEPVKKIATSLTVSDEMLEDANQVQSYINGRLSLFVKIEEERQLVLGGGTNELVGLTGRSGVHTYARGTVDNNAVALFKALNGTRGSSFLEPDAIVMNPANWQTTRLLTDTAGQFFGGGPFQGPYGSGSNIQASGQVTGALDTLWGKPVVVTTAVGAGTALVGAFSQAAQLFRRGGVTVEATNAHASYFTSNLVAIRAEERLALAVYRPGAFTTVSGLA